ncbi:unnamed protein product, partial [Scytosiphon promiscuus]
ARPAGSLQRHSPIKRPQQQQQASGGGGGYIRRGAAAIFGVFGYFSSKPASAPDGQPSATAAVADAASTPTDSAGTTPGAPPFAEGRGRGGEGGTVDASPLDAAALVEEGGGGGGGGGGGDTHPLPENSSLGPVVVEGGGVSTGDVEVVVGDGAAA